MFKIARRHKLYLLFLLVYHASYILVSGQDFEDFLIKEIVTERLSDNSNPESWKKDSQELYTYNAQQKKESEVYYFWDGGRKIKSSESKSEYDIYGNRIYYNFIEYDFDGNILTEYTSNEKYIDGILRERRFDIAFEQAAEVEIEIFNELGERIISQRNFSYENGDFGINKSSFGYNENGCLAMVNDSSYSIRNGEVYQFYSRHEYHYDNDCQLKEQRFFEFNFENMELNLISTNRWEYETDSLGSFLKQTNYFKNEISDSVFVKTYEEFSKYGADGSIEERNSFGFDNIGQYTYWSKWVVDKTAYKSYYHFRTWDQEINSWSHQHIEESSFLNESMTKLVQRVSFYNWDKATQQYLSGTEEKHIYDENEYLIEEIDIYFDNYEGVIYESISKIKYGRLCDGRIMSRTYGYGYDNLDVTYTQRTNYVYYDKPLCDTETPVSENIIVFPNPARDYIHIQLPVTVKSADFFLFGSDGSKVYETTLDRGNFFTMPMDLFKSNSYIIKVASDEGEFTGRVVKLN